MIRPMGEEAVRAPITVLVASLLLCTQLSWADVVELKTGQRIEGTLRQTTQAGVVIEVAGQMIRFDREKVRAIYFGPAPPGQVSPVAAGSTDRAKRTLDAVRAVQSATRAGVNYREYSARVLDAKVSVDREFAGWDEPSDQAMREQIAGAMELYLTVSEAWNTKLTKQFPANVYNATDRTLELCPTWASLKREMVKKEPSLALYERRISDIDFKYLWSCASEKITEAERALKAIPSEMQK